MRLIDAEEKEEKEEKEENAMYCMTEDCPYQKGEPCTAAEGCGGFEGVE